MRHFAVSRKSPLTLITTAILALGLITPLGLAATSNPSDVANNKSSGGGRSEKDGPAKVWQYLNNPNYCPETALVQPQVSAGGGIQFQSAQELWIGGRKADGWHQTVSTAQALDAACELKDMNGANVCSGNRDKVKRACDVAAKIYGIPSQYLICAEYVEKKDIKRKQAGSDQSATRQNSGAKSETEARKEAEDNQSKAARNKFFQIMKGNPSNANKNFSSPGSATGGASQKQDEGNSSQLDPSGSCLHRADSARRTINKLEDTILNTQFLKGENTHCDFYRMLELVMVARFGNFEEAHKMIVPKGTDLQVQSNRQYEDYFKALMECMNAVGAKKDSKPFDAKTCYEQKQ